MQQMQDKTTEDTFETASQEDKSCGEMLVVASKVRDMIRRANCNTAGDALEGLNEWIHWLVKQAIKRADANGRKTIRTHDFMVF